MKPYLILILAFLSFSDIKAQDVIRNVIVETYYISDANDATDTTGGFLEPGSKTYRIYIQMKPGCMLKKIYGDNLHPLSINSTAKFFNNKDYGQLFGKNITEYSLKKNTTALDTWLTLGQITKTAANTYFGILKSQDKNGSIIGGVNNDGGSAGAPGGLLTNDNSLAGLHLTTADGMDTMNAVPENWADWGISDSSIFGPIIAGSEFVSNDSYLQNSGVMGINPEINQVLVAQLTTKGEISFMLNVEIIDIDGIITKYVAAGKDSADVKVSRYLKYPPDCGCTNSDYKEYNSEYTCSNTDSCKTRIVFGCMDPQSCNYNPIANYNLSTLCCYPGKCGDRDISLVCPSLGEPQPSVKVYPNPASAQLIIEYSSIDNKEIEYSIYNSFGEVIFEKKLGLVLGSFTDNLEISNYNAGVYLIRLYIGDSSYNRRFVKN
jgi:hypothetical protein